MSRDVPNRGTSRTVGFRKITESFLTCKGLPFDSVLPKEKIHEIFSKYSNLFAANGIYSTAVVLWAFLGQVLRDGKEASCQFAVSCIDASTARPEASTEKRWKALTHATYGTYGSTVPFTPVPFSSLTCENAIAIIHHRFMASR